MSKTKSDRMRLKGLVYSSFLIHFHGTKVYQLLTLTLFSFVFWPFSMLIKRTLKATLQVKQTNEMHNIKWNIYLPLSLL